MRLLAALLRPLAVVLLTTVKVVIVFYWSTLRDLATAVADEVRAVRSADADDWRR
jgi:hypothetical protein